MLADGPSRRSRSRTVQGAAKPARRCRWATLCASQGRAAVGSNGFQAQAGSFRAGGLFSRRSHRARLPFAFTWRAGTSIESGSRRVVADDEPAVAQVAQERQTQLDLTLGLFLGLASAEHELHRQPRAIDLEQPRQLRPIGLEHGRLAERRLPPLLDFSSLIRSRARPTLELKIRYLPTWAVAGVKL